MSDARMRTLPIVIGDVISWGRGSERYRAQRAIVSEISTGPYSSERPARGRADLD